MDGGRSRSPEASEVCMRICIISSLFLDGPRLSLRYVFAVLLEMRKVYLDDVLAGTGMNVVKVSVGTVPYRPVGPQIVWGRS